MENKVFVSNKKAEEFYNSLTEQEKEEQQCLIKNR